MQSGDFATHLRRMRRTYAKRQAHLIAALDAASAYLDMQPDASGMYLCCALRSDISLEFTDSEISRLATQRRLDVRALSFYSVLPDPPQGLLLGYAAFDEDTLDRAAGILTEVLSATAKGKHTP